MTDHKASIKIEFEIYGIQEKYDAYINWSPNNEGVDGRVIGWLGNTFYAARQKYDQEYIDRERNKEREERKKLYLALKDEFKDRGDL